MKPDTRALDIRTDASVLAINGLRAEWLGRSIVIDRKRCMLRGVVMTGRTHCIAVIVDGTIGFTSASAVQRAFLVKAGG